MLLSTHAFQLVGSKLSILGEKIRRLGFSPIISVDLLFPISTLWGECLSTYSRLCMKIMYFRLGGASEKGEKEEKMSHRMRHASQFGLTRAEIRRGKYFPSNGFSVRFLSLLFLLF